MSKYDRIGRTYNYYRKADPYLLGRMIDLLELNAEGKYLDIGCGTGNYTSKFVSLGFDFEGADPSSLMLETASERYPEIKWHLGTAEDFHLESESLDGIMAGLTIHHWGNLDAAMKNLGKGLKSGGKFLIFTTTRTQTREIWLNHYFPMMLQDSTNQLPAYDDINKAFNEAGLIITATEPYYVHPELEDHFLYSGKHDPEKYFNQDFRNGISSFADLANREEVEAGLAKMREDIDSGEIKKVIRKAKNDLGDYLFILAEKIDLLTDV